MERRATIGAVFLVGTALATAIQPVAGQRAAAGSSASQTRRVIVPPGYTDANVRGIDPEIGEFVKPGGPTIRYAIGALRAPIIHIPTTPQLFESTTSFKVAWSKALAFRGSIMRVFMITGGELRVDTGVAGFIATNVRSHEDVADVLLTAHSFEPELRRREQQPVVGQQNPPGGMVVLPGYTFTRVKAIDSESGRFEKPAGPTISYELGALRAPIANTPRTLDLLWSRTVVLRGTTVRAYMNKGAGLWVDSGSGHFVARNVKSQEDVADVLLTVLSYDPDVRRREIGTKKP